MLARCNAMAGSGAGDLEAAPVAEKLGEEAAGHPVVVDNENPSGRLVMIAGVHSDTPGACAQ